MTAPSWFIDVILPLPLSDLYTYGISAEQSRVLSPGCRVIVQFGKRKYYTALVMSIHTNKPAGYQVKDIYLLLDKNPVVNKHQLRFWEWISDYYMCTIGEVYKSAMPSALKPESETRIIALWNESQEIIPSDTEELVLNALLKSNGMTLKQLNTHTGKKNLLPVINSMLEKGMIQFDEHLIEKYKPKRATFVRLSKYNKKEKQLNELLKKLERTPKQVTLLLKYLDLSKTLSEKTDSEIEKSELLKKSMVSQSVLNSLVKKGVLELYEKESPGLIEQLSEPKNITTLSECQDKAYKSIKEKFTGKEVALLHGVTSSGKTEIYIHLINEQINKNKQVLYLLPEIALTSQIINRLKSVFGHKAGIYHSRFSNTERVEVYNNILGLLKPEQTKYQVILGARSAVFLPFDNLGLIIADEEHENSYKQFDPSPRYHARDAAIMLAKIHHAKVLLGSATPSLESYYNALRGKYGLIELNERYLNLEMPEIRVVDLIKARKRKEMQSHFSTILVNYITKALENKEQVILFQNRRGFSPYLSCDTCGWIPMCKHCAVSLTYHKKFNKLVCHYCGYTINNLKTCQSCGGSSLLSKGFGTEKIEDEIGIMFPEAKIARLDLDNARTKNSYSSIISGFESGNIDILVGTQMISKGLDFDNVKVVGILNADNSFHYPDFRSYERSYQLIAQVGGRAGRKNGRGVVIIQTADPGNPVIKSVVHNDYKTMYSEQIYERKNFKYPPFYRLVSITLKHKTIETVNRASEEFAHILKSEFGKRVIGPEFPIINKIQNWFLKSILIKYDKDNLLSANKIRLKKITEEFISGRNYSNLQININVDPM